MILLNGYHVLGLDVTTSQKQINKRGKDILKYLTIWEIPAFENDFPFTEKYRNEIYVNQSINYLADPKKRLNDYFFWLNIGSDKAKEILRKVSNSEYLEAIEMARNCWEKKNFALLLAIMLSDDESIKSFDKNQREALAEESMKIFHELISDDRFWKNFEKEFSLFDDISTSNTLIEEFRKNVSRELGDIFYEVSQKSGTNVITKKFTEIFQVVWWKLHSDSEKLHLKLEELARAISDMDISADWEFDDDEKESLQKCIKEIKRILSELKTLWLYEDSKTLVIRDKIAKSLRSITLDLYNNLDEDNEALEYLKVAIGLCGTEWYKSKIQQDYDIIHGRTKFSENFKSIIANIDAEKYDEALWEILEIENEVWPEQKQNIEALKKRVIFEKIWTTFIQAKKLFESKKYSQALPLYQEVEKLSKDSVYLFDWINEEGLNEILDSIRNQLSGIKNWTADSAWIDSLFEEVDSIRSELQEKLSKDDGYFTIFYIDSITYGFLCGLYWQWGSTKPAFLYTLNGCGVTIYGDTTYLTFLFIPIIPISRWNVTPAWGNQYKFYGKKEMQAWKVWWRNIGLAAMGLFVLISIADSGSSSSTSSTRTNSSYSSPSSTSSNYTPTTTSSSKPTSSTTSSTKPKWPCVSWNYSCPQWVSTSTEDSEIETLERRIKNAYVDEYDQASINSYNSQVDKMNQLIKERNEKLNNLCTCR